LCRGRAFFSKDDLVCRMGLKTSGNLRFFFENTIVCDTMILFTIPEREEGFSVM